mmetsp:Transcript_9515/g.20063  ORF Transcript_9515/g.20063 Transcript_9515/m.20063 type:complete len:341 (-) Transcript_9515:198-1220(-)
MQARKSSGGLGELLDTVIDPLDVSDDLFVKHQSAADGSSMLKIESQTLTEMFDSAMRKNSSLKADGSASGGALPAQNMRGLSKGSDLVEALGLDFVEAPVDGEGLVDETTRGLAAEKSAVFGERVHFSFDEFKYLDEMLTNTPANLQSSLEPIYDPSLAVKLDTIGSDVKQEPAVGAAPAVRSADLPPQPASAVPAALMDVSRNRSSANRETSQETGNSTYNTQDDEDPKRPSFEVNDSRSIDALLSPRRLEQGGSSQSGGSAAQDRRMRSWLAVRRSREKKKAESQRMEQRFTTLSSENQELKSLKVELDKYIQLLQYKIALAMAEHQRTSENRGATGT